MSIHKPDASKRIDELIEGMPDFSKKICTKLRQLIHKADPKIIEDWKWGPNFYHNGMVCGFGAFKGWVTFTFFQGSQMRDTHKLFNYGDANAHNRSIKFTDVLQINEKALINYIQEAVEINKKGKALSLSNAKNKKVYIPKDLKVALVSKKFLEKFEGLTYTARKEYAQLVEEAKQRGTKLRRIQRVLERIAEGKSYY